jgi:lipid-A-disaccharide synthase
MHKPYPKKQIFIMTGEASGDMHGSMLVKALKKHTKALDFYGVGGTKLIKEKVNLLYNYANFTSMGITEPLLKLRFYKMAMDHILDFIISYNIYNVILIDFPGFNLLLAKKIKKYKSSVKIIYYISPQLWAWHYSRIKKIKRYIDAMVVLYPFEEEMYKKEGIKAFFAGNPLVDIVLDKLDKSNGKTIGARGTCISMLPGSRLSEVKRHLPAMLDAARLLQDKYNASFLLPLTGGKAGTYVKKVFKSAQYKNLNLKLIFNNTYKAIRSCRFAIVSSGTATLETAIIGKPMVVIYRVDFISELTARLLLRIKDIALVNIVAGKRICPELLQRDVAGEKIFTEVSKYLDNKDLMKEMISEIRKVKNKIGNRGAIKRIAKLMLSLIYE